MWVVIAIALTGWVDKHLRSVLLCADSPNLGDAQTNIRRNTPQMYIIIMGTTESAPLVHATFKKGARATGSRAISCAAPVIYALRRCNN